MSQTQLKVSLAVWRRRATYRKARLDAIRSAAHRGGQVTHAESAHIKKWQKLLEQAAGMIALRQRQLAAHKPLRLRALAEALKLVGIMEVGGNNMGKRVSEIIRANGGTGPEAWCGDTMAFVYRKAGSKVVQRGWAAVRLIGFLTGMRVVSYRDALPGDLVCYRFDHVGMLKQKLGNGEIETVEGNTGSSGAVSDSRTGGDGVYIKRRSTTLVARYVRVTR
jgi:hypothetical protein